MFVLGTLFNKNNYLTCLPNLFTYESISNITLLNIFVLLYDTLQMQIVFIILKAIDMIWPILSCDVIQH